MITLYILTVIGISLLSIGISFAILRKNRKWHIMTGFGAGVMTAAFCLFIVMLISTIITVSPMDYSASDYDNIYFEGYDDGYSDAYNEIFGDVFPEDNDREHNYTKPDDDYFIGDFISDFLKNGMQEFN